MRTVLFVISLCFSLSLRGATFPTVFTYSEEEKEEIGALESGKTITRKDLCKWDEIAQDSLKKAATKSFEKLRCYTYLYNAQRDVAFLSYNIKGRFEGSIDPISSAILSLFLPNFTFEERSDDYSTKLTSIVFKKYRERFEKEQALPFEFKVPEKYKEIYTVGLYVGKWIPWVAKPSMAYFPPPPPPQGHPQWKEELDGIRKEQATVNAKMREAIFLWAGEKIPGFEDWDQIGNAYMFKHSVPLGKMLLVRSQLLTALYDTAIVCLSAKYYYLIDRPKVLDNTIQYVIPSPLHPSYPSGHSSMAGAGATILSYYFPESASKWRDMAEESGHSRIWAGIHYPLDHKQGMILGERVARRVIICS